MESPASGSRPSRPGPRRHLHTQPTPTPPPPATAAASAEAPSPAASMRPAHSSHASIAARVPRCSGSARKARSASSASARRPRASRRSIPALTTVSRSAAVASSCPRARLACRLNGLPVTAVSGPEHPPGRGRGRRLALALREGLACVMMLVRAAAAILRRNGAESRQGAGD